MSVLFLRDLKKLATLPPTTTKPRYSEFSKCLSQSPVAKPQAALLPNLQIAARRRIEAKGIGSDVILLHLQQPMFPTLNITSCDPSVDQCAVCNLGDTGNLQFSRAICVKDLKPQILNFIRYQSESIKHFGAADFGLF